MYKTHKSILAVETYDILITTKNRIGFELLTKQFDELFDYTFQEGLQLKLLNITIIQS